MRSARALRGLESELFRASLDKTGIKYEREKRRWIGGNLIIILFQLCPKMREAVQKSSFKYTYAYQYCSQNNNWCAPVKSAHFLTHHIDHIIPRTSKGTESFFMKKGETQGSAWVVLLLGMYYHRMERKQHYSRIRGTVYVFWLFTEPRTGKQLQNIESLSKGKTAKEAMRLVDECMMKVINEDPTDTPHRDETMDCAKQIRLICQEWVLCQYI